MIKRWIAAIKWHWANRKGTLEYWISVTKWKWRHCNDPDAGKTRCRCVNGHIGIVTRTKRSNEK